MAPHAFALLSLTLTPLRTTRTLAGTKVMMQQEVVLSSLGMNHGEGNKLLDVFESLDADGR